MHVVVVKPSSNAQVDECQVIALHENIHRGLALQSRGNVWNNFGVRFLQHFVEGAQKRLAQRGVDHHIPEA